MADNELFQVLHTNLTEAEQHFNYALDKKHTKTERARAMENMKKLFEVQQKTMQSLIQLADDAQYII